MKLLSYDSIYESIFVWEKNNFMYRKCVTYVNHFGEIFVLNTFFFIFFFKIVYAQNDFYPCSNNYSSMWSFYDVNSSF